MTPSDFRTLVDQELDSLCWRPRNRSAVLSQTKGGGKVRRKLTVCLVTALLLLLTAVSVLAAYHLLRAPEAEAIHQARQAVMDAYGLTPETLGLFYVQYETADDGWCVTLRPGGLIDSDRAGSYAVSLAQNKLTTDWTHDGWDASAWADDDLTAPAYGQAQLLYALHDGKDEALLLAQSSEIPQPAMTPPSDSLAAAGSLPSDEASVFMDVRETTPDADDISLPEAKAAMRCAVQEEFGLSDEQTRHIGTQEDYDEVAVRFVTDPAGRRMWEFFVELNLDGTACSIGIYVNAANGEIVLLDYVTGGNG